MEAKHRRGVTKRLTEAMAQDKARVEIGRISKFGLLELSRQRIKARLMMSSHLVCPHCEGSGYIMTTDFQAMSMLRRLQELSVSAPRKARIVGRLPAAIALKLLNSHRASIADLEERFEVEISSFQMRKLQELEMLSKSRLINMTTAIPPIKNERENREIDVQKDPPSRSQSAKKASENNGGPEESKAHGDEDSNETTKPSRVTRDKGKASLDQRITLSDLSAKRRHQSLQRNQPMQAMTMRLRRVEPLHESVSKHAEPQARSDIASSQNSRPVTTRHSKEYTSTSTEQYRTLLSQGE